MRSRAALETSTTRDQIPVGQEYVRVCAIGHCKVENPLKTSQLGRVRGRLVIQPYPLLRAWPRFRWQLGAGGNVPVVDDHSVRLLVRAPVVRHRAPADLMERQTVRKFAVATERMSPDQQPHRAVVLRDRRSRCEWVLQVRSAEAQE